MRIAPRTSFIVLGLVVLTIAAGSGAVFDELSELKQELTAWQTTHTADFSDLMETLDTLAGPSFIDVHDEDWFKQYVVSVAEWGIVSGYKDGDGKSTGVFGPGNPVTIAEMLKIVFEASQTDELKCDGTLLASSEKDHWAAPYVACGLEKQMRILRLPNIDLNRPALRGEVLSILHDGFGETVPPLYSNFRDVSGHPYEADVAYAALKGVVSGDKAATGEDLGTFRPNDLLNRAEASKIVYEKLKDNVREESAVVNR